MSRAPRAADAGWPRATRSRWASRCAAVAPAAPPASASFRSSPFLALTSAFTSWPQVLLPSRTAILFAVPILLLSLNAANADSYSRYCPASEPNKTLAPGTWKGTFEGVDTGELSGEADFRYLWRTSGTFTLDVGEDRRARDFSATLVVEAATEGSAEDSDAAASGQIRRTTAKLQLDERSKDNDVTRWFSAEGRLQAQLAGQVRAPQYSRKFQQEGSDDVTLTFLIKNATCQGADGVFERSGLQERYDRMRQGGMKIEQGPARWHAEPQDASTFDEDMATLKKKLAEARNPPGPNPVVRTRTVEMRMYVEIAQWIEGRSKTVKPCLLEAWRGAVQDRFHEWFAIDIPAMRDHKGDLVSYRDKLRRLIELNNGVAMLGLDECHAAQQIAAFDATGTAAWYQITRMLDSALPLADVLDVLRESEFVGKISPTAKERVMERIKNRAREEFKSRERHWLDLVKLRAANAPPSADEGAAWCNAVRALKELELVGATAPATTIGDYLGKYPVGCVQ